MARRRWQFDQFNCLIVQANEECTAVTDCRISMMLTYRVPEQEYELKETLFGHIDPEASGYDIRATQLALKLKKQDSAHWTTLEKGAGPAPAAASSAPVCILNIPAVRRVVATLVRLMRKTSLHVQACLCLNVNVTWCCRVQYIGAGLLAAVCFGTTDLE